MDSKGNASFVTRPVTNVDSFTAAVCAAAVAVMLGTTEFVIRSIERKN